MAMKKYRNALAKRRRRSRRRPAIKAREGLGSGRYDLNRYCYNEDDTIDVGTIEARKIGQDIDLGNAFGERDGSRIYVDYINVKLSLINPNASELDSGWLRLMVLENKFIGTSYSAGMFNSETSDRSPVDYSIAGYVFQMVKALNTHKFNVYYDRVYKVKTQLGGADDPHTLLINVNIPIKKIFVYDTNVVADSAIVPDMDMLFFVERQDGAAAFTGSLSYHYQLITYFKSLD